MNKLAYYMMNSKIKQNTFWECNFNVDDAKKFGAKSQFWQDLLIAWREYNYGVPSEPDQMANQVIWYNSHIRIANQMVYKKRWFEMGIIYVKDLIMEDHLMTYREFRNVYDSTINEMEFNALMAAISKIWKRAAAQYSDIEWANNFDCLDQYTKWSSYVYN